MLTNSRNPRPFGLSASIVCADMLEIGREIDCLNRARVETIHFDVMDGVFVPRLGLLPEMLKAIHRRTDIPVDVHLMIEDPEPYLAAFVEAGATYISVHAEGNRHLLRTVQKIRKLGARAGIALNPATPISVLEHLLDEIDMVLVMGINPGIPGQPLWSGTIAKIRALREMIGPNQIVISVDGGVSFATAPKLIDAGADYLVCGTSTIYQPPAPVERKVEELRMLLRETEPAL